MSLSLRLSSVLSLAYISGDLTDERAVEELLRQRRGERETLAAERALLDAGDFAAIEEYVRRIYTVNAQLMPLKTYIGQYVANAQRMQNFGGPEYRSHPLQPVAMRGSKDGIRARYEWTRYDGHHLAGLAYSRWVAKKRIACLSADECEDLLTPMMWQVKQRYDCPRWHSPHNPIRFSEVSEGFRFAILNGKEVWISAAQHENITALRGIIAKTDKLQERMEMLRQHRREQSS